MLPSNLDIQELLKQAFSIGNYDVIIAMGGGYVVDCGKYIAFSKRTPFISIPTSASNDGFASSNCSLQVEGKNNRAGKGSVWIIADLSIIQKAPEHFIWRGSAI